MLGSVVTVDDQRVDIAIVVIVEECRPIPIHFNDVVLRRAAADVQQRDACLLGNVDEPNHGTRGLRPCHEQR
jgi:hypothetical protein